MQQSFDEMGDKITYLVGTTDIIREMQSVPVKPPFSEEILEFLGSLSKKLINCSEAKKYPDVITLGFWLRKASLNKLKERFEFTDGNIHLGRGVAFHIAPSNVPVNYMYSLATGLLTGNANIVRIPSKDFPQIKILNNAIVQVLEEHKDIKPYICFVRYGREKKINDFFSSICDVRIVWGGDATIANIRESLLPPRATEVTFADRFSFAVIDSDSYIDRNDKVQIAQDFYNDTYLTDQNACTSPRLVVWTGTKKDEAKEIFWNHLHKIVSTKYNFQPIMAMNKLTSAYLMAVKQEETKIEKNKDNLIIRVNVSNVNSSLIELRDNSGYFFEYDCDDLLELRELCNDKRIQTISFIGEKEQLQKLLLSGIKGVDRVVLVGKTMDFDLIWDGYNLVEKLTRTIQI